MGAINRQEYEGIIREMKLLEEIITATDLGDVVPLPEGIETINEARRRLKDLQELAYSVNDSIGKSGIEGRFENSLRGFRGKKSYYSDVHGNILHELPGTREPLPGKRILLTISSQLQEYAEKLLVENEKIRQPIMSRLGPDKKNIVADKHPWIKGGSIVAMDPNNGEVIVLATHPRFDPNDFVLSRGIEENTRRKKNLLQWLESDSYLGEIWDRQRLLERETAGREEGIYLEAMPLTWNNYLNFILSKKSQLRNSVLTQGSVFDAVKIQQNIEALFSIAPESSAYEIFNRLYNREEHQLHGKQLADLNFEVYGEGVDAIRQNLDRYFETISQNYEKVLLVDLLRVAVPADRFSDELLSCVGNQRISDYRAASGAIVKIHDVVKKMCKNVFHDSDFKQWRNENEKEFLKAKRLEEQLNHKYARPYIDYLDALENEMFISFWEKRRWELILSFLKGGSFDDDYQRSLQGWRSEYLQGAHQEVDWAAAYGILKDGVEPLPTGIDLQYLQTLRSFQELERPLLGKYRTLRKNNDNTQQEKHLALGFYPKYGYGYGRSQAYRQATTQGSIFKLVTAYEAMAQRYCELEASGGNLNDLNPLTIHDRVWKKGKEMYLGLHADGTAIPRHYKGGRMPRSLSSNIGQLDVAKALEMSSNPYFAILAGDVLKSPEDLADTARQFSYGSPTGIDLPGEIGGRIPDDLEYNRTGLYSFSIGQHTLVVTPLQTSVMLSALVNGGEVYKPNIVGFQVGKEPKRCQELISGNYGFAYQESLARVGINFPLFIGDDKENEMNVVKKIQPKIKREIFLPEEIQKILLEGMSHVVERTQKSSLISLSRLYYDHPEAISDYVEIKKQFIGKTSTSESVENIDLDLEEGTNIYTHVWFGGVSYEKDILSDNGHKFLFYDASGSPELVVVVYLRYGGYGKEAAPVAAQIAKKWKEIKRMSL